MEKLSRTAKTTGSLPTDIAGTVATCAAVEPETKGPLLQLPYREMHDRKRVQGEFQIKIAQTDSAILT
ncbi:MAG: hypothetical protein CMJ47_10125 [Planctomyces sp.]|nr:hypothetical protein [Planctomyces sp.]